MHGRFGVPGSHDMESMKKKFFYENISRAQTLATLQLLSIGKGDSMLDEALRCVAFMSVSVALFSSKYFSVLAALFNILLLS